MNIIKAIILIFIIAACSTTIKQTDETDIGVVSIEDGFQYFVTSSKVKWLKNVVSVSNCIAHNEKFLLAVSNIEKFDYTLSDGIDVAISLGIKKKVILNTYWYLKKKVKSYSKAGTNRIYYNTRSNPRGLNLMINTAFHEKLHFLGYGHNGNYNQHLKQGSVNHVVGKLAEKYINDCVF